MQMKTDICLLDVMITRQQMRACMCVYVCLCKCVCVCPRLKTQLERQWIKSHGSKHQRVALPAHGLQSELSIVS